MTKYSLSYELSRFIQQDGDLSQYSVDNLGGSLNIYHSEDYTTLPEVKYPLVHVFTYKKEDSERELVYSTAVEIQVRRLVDNNGFAEHGVDGNITYEPIIGSTEEFTEMVIKSIHHNLQIFGAGGEKGYEIVSTQNITIPPNGEQDILIAVELTITKEKC